MTFRPLHDRVLVRRIEAATKSVVRSMGSTLGRQIVRGVLGSIFRGR